jgi:hypothetical protein
MSLEDLTEKYTGRRIDTADVRTAIERGGPTAEPARALNNAVYSLQSAETELLRYATSLQDISARIRDNITAVAGQPVQHLNSSGELQSTGVRVDQLIAQRADRLHHLTVLVRLWQYRTTATEPMDPSTSRGSTPDAAAAHTD